MLRYRKPPQQALEPYLQYLRSSEAAAASQLRDAAAASVWLRCETISAGGVPLMKTGNIEIPSFHRVPHHYEMLSTQTLNQRLLLVEHTLTGTRF